MPTLDLITNVPVCWPLWQIPNYAEGDADHNALCRFLMRRRLRSSSLRCDVTSLLVVTIIEPLNSSVLPL